MILYTPLCQEDVFPETNESSYAYVHYQGKMVCVDEQDGKHTLVQLLSTNPQDFMDASFSPGTAIEMK